MTVYWNGKNAWGIFVIEETFLMFLWFSVSSLSFVQSNINRIGRKRKVYVEERKKWRRYEWMKTSFRRQMALNLSHNLLLIRAESAPVNPKCYWETFRLTLKIMANILILFNRGVFTWLWRGPWAMEDLFLGHEYHRTSFGRGLSMAWLNNKRQLQWGLQNTLCLRAIQNDIHQTSLL